MFEKIFQKPWYITRHKQAPLLDERSRFLAHLSNLGFTRPHLATVAAELLGIIGMLNLKESGYVGAQDIRDAAQQWAARPRTSNKTKSTKSSRDHFVNVATKWLRFMGRLESLREAFVRVRIVHGK
jgi:hypothetical protein